MRVHENMIEIYWENLFIFIIKHEMATHTTDIQVIYSDE